MCDGEKLKLILEEFVNEIKKLFGAQFKAAILFRSYARGDNDEESDIDIMVLVSIGKEEIEMFHSQVVKIVTRLNLTYDVVISPIIQNFEEYNKYKEVSGFFKNVLYKGGTNRCLMMQSRIYQSIG